MTTVTGWTNMLNRSMQRKLNAGDAKNVAPFRQADGVYALPRAFFEEDTDYCDAQLEVWIWSIGRDKEGHDFAATDARYYQDEAFTCIWLR